MKDAKTKLFTEKDEQKLRDVWNQSDEQKYQQKEKKPTKLKYSIKWFIDEIEDEANDVKIEKKRDKKNEKKKNEKKIVNNSKCSLTRFETIKYMYVYSNIPKQAGKAKVASLVLWSFIQ